MRGGGGEKKKYIHILSSLAFYCTVLEPRCEAISCADFPKSAIVGN